MVKQYIVTEEKLKRVEVIGQVISGILKGAQETRGLATAGLRIKERFIREGFEGLRKRLRYREPMGNYRNKANQCKLSSGKRLPMNGTKSFSVLY